MSAKTMVMIAVVTAFYLAEPESAEEMFFFLVAVALV